MEKPKKMNGESPLGETEKDEIINKEYAPKAHRIGLTFSLIHILIFFQPISEATVKIFFSFEDTEHARWMTEPAEIFAAINRTADEKLVNKMIAALHKEAERFFQKRNHHLHQSLLEASIRSGRQLIKCLASFVDDEFLAKYLQAVSSSKTPGTYPVSLAISAKLFGIPKRKAALMFFYGFAVSIVGAALRLGILQHFEGQQILNELKPTISETINRYISTPYDQMWQFAPQADIIQIHHEKMYSKMFIT